MAVYDCFTFFNELDLLDVRLNILDEYVDKFVLVEMPCTFQGKKKNLIFKENRERFRKYLDKIIYVCPSEFPMYNGDGDFGIEYFQRNSILEALTLCDPEDIVIISDIDEIPNPIGFKEKIALSYNRDSYSFKRNIKTLLYELSFGRKSIVKKIITRNNTYLHEWLDVTTVSLEQELFYYFMNCRSKGKWYGPVICKYKNMNMPQRLRDNRELLPFIEKAGWHFSYLGGIKKIKEKLASIVDSDPNIVKTLRKYSKDDEYIRKCILSGKDILGRSGKNFEYEFINDKELGIGNLKEIKNIHPYFFLNPSLEESKGE